jgi:hypothetical protein
VHAKFPNQGHTNAFLTSANEHYAVNLRGVNAKLRAQNCPRNQNKAGSDFYASRAKSGKL